MKTIYNPTILDFSSYARLALDTEFNSLSPVRSRVLCIALSDGETKWVYDTNAYDKKDIVTLLTSLHDVQLVAHNAKIDCLMLYANYKVLLRNWMCTFLSSQIIDNGYVFSYNMVGAKGYEKPHNLLACLDRFLDIKETESSYKKRMQLSFIHQPAGMALTTEQMDYAADDVGYLLQLADAQYKHLKERELLNVMSIENKLSSVLAKMELRGILVDQDKHRQNIRNWQQKLLIIEQQMDEFLAGFEVDGVQAKQRPRERVGIVQGNLFGANEKTVYNKNVGHINYASTAQLAELWDTMGWPKPRDVKDEAKGKNSSGYSFSMDAMTNYKVEHGSESCIPLIDLLIKHSEMRKKISTYGEKLLSCLDADGRMRTSYGQCFTDTGRLTSSAIMSKKNKAPFDNGYNLANIPKDNDVRNIFVADEGYTFVDSDQTGQELIIAACYSGEQVLIKAFKDGFDHHSFLASGGYGIIFRQPDFEVKNEDVNVTIGDHTYNLKKNLRQDFKACTFSLIYGGGKQRVFEYLSSYISNHWPADQGLAIADQVCKRLKADLPDLVKWLQNQVNLAKKYGYIVGSKIGRRRYWDDPSDVYGEAMNFPIQNSGAESIKLALIRLDRWLGEKSAELGIAEEELGWLTLTVYDQNIVSLNDKYLDYASEIQRIMAESLSFFLTGLEGSSDLNITKQWTK